jgi:hypothetical protein
MGFLKFLECFLNKNLIENKFLKFEKLDMIFQPPWLAFEFINNKHLLYQTRCHLFFFYIKKESFIEQS